MNTTTVFYIGSQIWKYYRKVRKKIVPVHFAKNMFLQQGNNSSHYRAKNFKWNNFYHSISSILSQTNKYFLIFFLNFIFSPFLGFQILIVACQTNTIYKHVYTCILLIRLFLFYKNQINYFTLIRTLCYDAR
jgi:hypothetical protein